MGRADVVIAEARGFMKSRVILTAAELNFFTRLDEKPCSAGELAREKGLDIRAATRVLDCLVTFGLLEKQDSVYKPTESGAFYSSLHPQTVLPMILHMNLLWDTWSNLTEVVKEGGHPERDPDIQMDDESWKSFIGRGGDTYTFKEVKEGLERAGFTNVQQVRYGEGMDCLVAGQKPA